MSEKSISIGGDLNNKEVQKFLEGAGAIIKDNNNYDLMTSYNNDIINGGAKSDEYSEPTFNEDVADIEEEVVSNEISPKTPPDKPPFGKGEDPRTVPVIEADKPIQKVEVEDKPKPKIVVEKSEPILEEYLEEDMDKDLEYEKDVDGDPDIIPYDYKTSVENSPLDVWGLIDTYFRDNPYHKTRHQLDSYDELLYSEKNGIKHIIKEENPFQLYKELDQSTNTFRYEISIYYGKIIRFRKKRVCKY